MNDQYECSIVYNKADTGYILLPVSLGRALKERGYNRASLTITDEGILVQPLAWDTAGKEER